LLGWLSKKATLDTPQLEQLTSKGPLYALLMGAGVAPLIEETLFRGWLDGRKRNLVFVIGLLLSFGAIWGLSLALPTQPLVTAGVGLALLVLTAVLTWRAGTSVPAWYQRYFPAFYFLSAVAFAISHFSNYSLDRPWLLVPFVLPQLVAGLIFGFARVRFGFWANLLLHMSSNALFLGLMIAGV
jgi:membrane protease YdiL (CAAX protease family)